MKVSSEELGAMYVYDSMLTLADTLEPVFPHHAKCIRDELLKWTLVDGEWKSSRRVMTETRWNRLADVIGSMAAMPGTLLEQDSKHVRLRALCAAEAPRAMARVCFGGKRGHGALDLAVDIAAEYSPPKCLP